MRLQHLLAGGTVALTLAITAPTGPALGEDTLYVPLLTYRTGPFAGSGIPIADGMRDYLVMLNERDGGIGGVKLVVEECETGYDAQKGVECYESTKGKGALVYNPYSTAITLQLIPKARSTRSRSCRWRTVCRRPRSVRSFLGRSTRRSPTGMAPRR